MNSGEVVMSTLDSGQDHIQRQQVVQFSDEVRGEVLSMPASSGIHSADGTSLTTGLGDFLKRPVRIYSDTWLESETAGTLIGEFDPWYIFFNDARIKYKLNNYSFIRCNLKLKIVINASPFYYGSALATYLPLQNFNGNTVPLSASNKDLIPYSQRPHIWIHAQNSQGGEMTLPFFWPYNWLRIGEASDFEDMGKIGIFSYTDLQQANGVTGTGVSYQVFAWAEDVELSGATTGLAMQCGDVSEYQMNAGDEYNGVISGPASAVANVAGTLTKTPVIGKFATAAQMGATAVAKISSLFGYTNLPNISDTNAVRSQPFPQMASGEISYPTESLSLDPKNGLSVDPGVVGLSSVDELNIQRFTSRESYLTSTVWSTADAVDKILFYTTVSPQGMFDVESTPGGSMVWFTPLSYMAEQFNCWHGDVVFRFRIIASQYHKGRIRISWDPTGDVSNNIVVDSSTITAVQTVVADIGKDNDIEFRVPYNQARGWLRIFHAKSTTPWSTSASPTWGINDETVNGALTIRVQNTLTAPVASSSITILISVRGENMQFNNPGTYEYQKYSPFEMHSGNIESEPLDGDVSRLVAGTPAELESTNFLVNFGEKITSAREIIRRPVLHRVSWHPDNSTNDQVLITEGFSKLPLYPGYDPHGIHSFKGVVATGTNFPFNCVNFVPFSWFNLCFVGLRGGVTWTFNSASAADMPHVRVVRKPARTVTSPFGVAVNGINDGTLSANSRFFLVADMGAGGTALTNQRTQSGVSVFCPQYNHVKFISTKPENVSFPTSNDGSSYEQFMLERGFSGQHSSAGVGNALYWYAAAGHDYTPLFFLNTPCLYEMTAAYPAAN